MYRWNIFKFVWNIQNYILHIESLYSILLSRSIYYISVFYIYRTISQNFSPRVLNISLISKRHIQVTRTVKSSSGSWQFSNCKGISTAELYVRGLCLPEREFSSRTSPCYGSLKLANRPANIQPVAHRDS